MDQSTTETFSSNNTSGSKGIKKQIRFNKWEKNRRKKKRAQGKSYVTKKINK